MRKFIPILLFTFLPGFIFTQKFEIIESGITMSWLQSFKEKGERVLHLKFETNDPFENSNYLLANTLDVYEGKIYITIKGIDEKSMEPDHVMGPATALFDLSSLSVGDYKVTVNINRQLFKGNLEVAKTYFSLTTDSDPDLLKIRNPRMNLIPANTIWGKVEYSDVTIKEAAEKFFADLKNEGCADTQFEIGSYGDFFLHEKGKTSEKALGNGKFEFPFVFNYSGDPERLKLLVDMYGQKYGAKIRIRLCTSSGEKYSGGSY